MDDLVERLRVNDAEIFLPLLGQAADRIEAQAAEIRSLREQVEKLSNDGIHTCHDQCPRLACVQRREIESLREQVAQERAGSEAATLAGIAMGLEAAAVQAMTYRTWVNWTGDTFPDEPGTSIRHLIPAAILAAHTRAEALSELAEADGVLLDDSPEGI